MMRYVREAAIWDYCRRAGLLNAKITSEMFFLCQNYWEKIPNTTVKTS